ncbi:MAG: (2Fe-2S)-binding protein [Anaerolineales bacterium]|nr:(2Fe-2S)-binding protein [Anaerolineales bacterium]
MATFILSVNGVDHTVEANPNMPLLWALRDLLNLTGTKYGCGIGMCGSCTVLMDGNAVRSCILPVSASADRAIITIEGFSTDGLHKVQQAWLAESVSQCGYCQPGKILTAAALLDKNPHPTTAEIDSAFENNLCRCGTYLRIRRAVQRAAEGG